MYNVWDDIWQKYEAMENMGRKPYGFKRVPSNFVFDEDKSVKWNKEQAQKNNDDYDNAIAVEHIFRFKQVRPADNVIDLRHVLACFHLAHHGCADRAQLTRVFVGIEPLVLRQSVS